MCVHVGIAFHAAFEKYFCQKKSVRTAEAGGTYRQGTSARRERSSLEIDLYRRNKITQCAHIYAVIYFCNEEGWGGGWASGTTKKIFVTIVSQLHELQIASYDITCVCVCMCVVCV